MKSDMIRTLLRYNVWAHARVWNCAVKLDADAFVRDVGYSFGSVRSQFVHVMSVDARWLARVRDLEVPAHLVADAFPTHAAVRETWNVVEQSMLDYAEHVTDKQLERTIEFNLAHRGGIRHNTVWQILTHVVNHGTDHRAQILAMLHQLGAPTVEQDLMFYLWE